MKVLEQMNKKLTAEQTLELAERVRRFGIIPEFSFVIGSPQNPDADTRSTIGFIPRDQAAESGGRDHCAALHSHTASGRDVWRGGWQDRISADSG